MGDPGFSRLLGRCMYEDQATEVVALALELDRNLMCRFIEAIAGDDIASGVAEELTVETQRRLDDGKHRVDLALEGERYVIWIEAKIDSDEGIDQLPTYGRALADLKAPSHRYLVYLTRPGISPPRIRSLAMNELADIAGVVALKDYDWRRLGELAKEVSESSGRSLAGHLYRFLEDRGLCVGALKPEDIATLEGLPNAWASFVQLFEMVDAEVAGCRTVGKRLWERRPGRYGQVRGTWFNRTTDGKFGAWAGYMATDSFADEPIWLSWDFAFRELDGSKPELTIAAGVTVSSPSDSRLLEGVREIVDVQEPYGDELSLLWLRRMSEVHELDPEQLARAIADWIESQFDRILKIVAGSK